MLPKERRINSKQELRERLGCELPKYGCGRIKSFLQIGESAILCRHQILLRKTEYYTNTGKRIFALYYRIRLSKFQNRYGLHIPVNCCGKGLRIMHVGPILINDRAVVGENCAFHINTALVAGGTTHDAPVLEDSVVCGIGSVVVGGVHIAKNVAIGANAVVNKDVVEENIAVAGVPAKKISNNGRLEWNKKRE